MAHARTTIRAALVAALIAAGTTAGANVFDEERTTALSAAAGDTDAVFIEWPSEDQTPTSMLSGRADRRLERTAVYSITFITKQTTGFLTRADNAMFLIEAALANLVSPAIKNITPIRAVAQLDTGGETPLYTVTQTIDVFYITTQGNPAATL